MTGILRAVFFEKNVICAEWNAFSLLYRSDAFFSQKTIVVVSFRLLLMASSFGTLCLHHFNQVFCLQIVCLRHWKPRFPLCKSPPYPFTPSTWNNEWGLGVLYPSVFLKETMSVPVWRVHTHNVFLIVHSSRLVLISLYFVRDLIHLTRTVRIQLCSFCSSHVAGAYSKLSVSRSTVTRMWANSASSSRWSTTPTRSKSKWSRALMASWTRTTIRWVAIMIAFWRCCLRSSCRARNRVHLYFVPPSRRCDHGSLCVTMFFRRRNPRFESPSWKWMTRGLYHGLCRSSLSCSHGQAWYRSLRELRQCRDCLDESIMCRNRMSPFKVCPDCVSHVYFFRVIPCIHFERGHCCLIPNVSY